MVVRSKRYEAVCEWPNGEKELVDAKIKSGETPNEAIQRILDEMYEPGAKILEIKEFVPDFSAWSIGGDQG